MVLYLLTSTFNIPAKCGVLFTLTLWIWSDVWLVISDQTSYYFDVRVSKFLGKVVDQLSALFGTPYFQQPCVIKVASNVSVLGVQRVFLSLVAMVIFRDDIVVSPQDKFLINCIRFTQQIMLYNSTAYLWQLLSSLQLYKSQMSIT